jgi:hypothetical protein
MTTAGRIGTAIAAVCMTACAGACATQFGRPAPMTFVTVASAKPDRNFYFITVVQEQTYFTAASRTVAFGTSPDLENLLRGKVWQTTNGLGLEHSSGEYALVVRCDHAYKVFSISVPYEANRSVTETVDCDGA